MKPLIYLATPSPYKPKSKEIGLNKPDYSDEVKRAEAEQSERVDKVLAVLDEKGFLAVTHTDQIIISQLVIRCDIVFVLALEEWKKDTDLQNHIALANQNGKPIFIIDENLRLIGGI